jgi:diacylglycerol O-acyltransferase / trehalose O-mycolyltransferase / mycolyltransferase Ag85
MAQGAEPVLRGAVTRKPESGRSPSPHRGRARAAAATVLLLALIGVGLLRAPAVRAECTPPRCFDVVVPLPHDVRVPDSTVRILLPADYASSRARYPVLYLLHGAGDTYATWTEQTDVEEFSAQFRLIIVMPDGGHDANAGFYSDWIDGSRQWESFHTGVLRRYVERNFRTLATRRHRAVAGLSMGGFGAMSYAARHNDLFQAAASFSGAVDSEYPTPKSNVLFGTHIVGPGLWGDPVADEATWRAHNPTDLVRRLRNTDLFLATGDGTKGGPAGDVDSPGAYGIEAIVYQMSLNLAQALQDAGIPFAADFYKGGYHGWPYWQRELHWSLPQIMQRIGSSGGPARVPLRRIAEQGAASGHELDAQHRTSWSIRTPASAAAASSHDAATIDG